MSVRPDSAPQGRGTTPSNDLDARYGRSPGSRRRTRIWVASLAGALLVAFAVWLAWGGLLGPSSQVEAQDTGHVVRGNTSVDIRWQLSVPPGSPSSCALQALNLDFGIVGWKIVHIPASPQRTRQFSDSIRTSEQAVSGLIYRCWLT
ncbi:MAG: hypothetical protein QOI02_1445 [Actinomycetota bacterium]|nr:hypothetical protein [Actinomycetota bacterium]